MEGIIVPALVLVVIYLIHRWTLKLHIEKLGEEMLKSKEPPDEGKA
jgi:hypothetical protein